MRGARERFVLDGREVVLETGRIARQAGGAVLARQGNTVVLVTAVAAREPRPDVGFLPLTVEYRELHASVGKIPGGYFKREGRLTDHEVLASRLIDRSVRPLFPAGYNHEVQVIATVLGAEEDCDPVPLALLGAHAALCLSPIPFHGPAGGVTLALVDERCQCLPTKAEREAARLSLTVAVGPEGLVMVEGALREVPETAVLDALDHARAVLRPFLEGLRTWRERVGRPKAAWTPPPPEMELRRRVRAGYEGPVREALALPDKQERRGRLDELETAWLDEAAGGDPERAAAAAGVFHDLVKEVMRVDVFTRGVRIVGRGLDEIRPIWGEVGWLPTNHGSAVFARGETQALVSCTLGSPEDEQIEDRLYGEERSRFLVHYNFPPYSVGETRPLRAPSRREIGHGNLARRALEPVLPPFESFPYTIRILSNITESNGSSSMATVCGGSLALMDAGVPVRAAVAGIAMGLLAEGDRVAILSDILGDEDHLGDMDFKVAGTADGITALQMDNKIGALPREVLARALEQARRGRRHILERMAAVIPAPRETLPDRAPRVVGVRIRPERVRDLIGPKGATIQEIQTRTGTRISVDDTGQVLIYSADGEAASRARQWVEYAAGDPRVGRVYRGDVVGVHDFGVFVRILGHTEGLVHVSEMAPERVEHPRDLVREGDQVLVKLLGVTREGKLKLSMKAARGVPPEEVVPTPASGPGSARGQARAPGSARRGGAGR